MVGQVKVHPHQPLTTRTDLTHPQPSSSCTHQALPEDCACTQLLMCEVTASENTKEVDTHTGPYASGLSAIRVMKGSA